VCARIARALACFFLCQTRFYIKALSCLFTFFLSLHRNEKKEKNTENEELIECNREKKIVEGCAACFKKFWSILHLFKNEKKNKS
jgi:hypothetical protein